jgi:hypothetical protein
MSATASGAGTFAANRLIHVDAGVPRYPFSSVIFSPNES